MPIIEPMENRKLVGGIDFIYHAQKPRANGSSGHFDAAYGVAPLTSKETLESLVGAGGASGGGWPRAGCSPRRSWHLLTKELAAKEISVSCCIEGSGGLERVSFTADESHEDLVLVGINGKVPTLQDNPDEQEAYLTQGRLLRHI